MHLLSRSLAAVVGIICILMAVVGLLAGNIQYRLIASPAIYQNVLSRNDAYEQIALSLIEEIDLPLIDTLSADGSLPALASALFPTPLLQNITEDAIAQGQRYLNQPDQSPVITIATWDLLEHLHEIIIADTCAAVAPNHITLCRDDLPALQTYLIETTAPEAPYDLQAALEPLIGSARENVIWLNTVVTVSLQVVGALLLLMLVATAFNRQRSQLLRWLGRTMAGIGFVLGLLVVGAGNVIQDSWATVVQTQAQTPISQMTTQFTADVSTQFALGLYVQAGVCLLLGIGLLIGARLRPR